MPERKSCTYHKSWPFGLSPVQVRIVLENLEIAAEEGAETALKAAAMRSQLTAEQLQVCAVGWLG